MSNYFSLKKIILANILLYVLSFFLMKFSDFFRLNTETHWIYAVSHSFWVLFAFPVTMVLSFILPFFLFKKNLNNKLLWILLSLIPLIFFIVSYFTYKYINQSILEIWKFFYNLYHY